MPLLGQFQNEMIELNDDYYNLLITKICDTGVYVNTNETIIESEEKELDEMKSKRTQPGRHFRVHY